MGMEVSIFITLKKSDIMNKSSLSPRDASQVLLIIKEYERIERGSITESSVQPVQGSKTVETSVQSACMHRRWPDQV